MPAGKVAQWLEHFLCNHGDLHLDSQHPCKILHGHTRLGACTQKTHEGLLIAGVARNREFLVQGETLA